VVLSSITTSRSRAIASRGLINDSLKVIFHPLVQTGCPCLKTTIFDIVFDIGTAAPLIMQEKKEYWKMLLLLSSTTRCNRAVAGGIKIGLNNYSRNWWKYSLSGLSQGYMEAKDKRTQQKEAYAEKAKEYYKNNSTMTGFEFQPKNWIDAIYDFQIVISPVLDISPANKKNNRLYSPARNY